MEEYKFLTYNVGKLNPASAMEYATVGGYAGLKIALANPSAVIQIVKDSGLRGRGGAGFPTGMKWTFVRNTDADQKYIVCNADEGEPGTNKDRILMAEIPNLLFEGMAIAGVAVGATKGYIYLRAEYPYVKEILLKALDDARVHHFLGKKIMDSDVDFDIEIRSGAGAYVCGEETAMLESIEGKRGEPRFKPPFPGVQGLWGKPTVINNVETLCNIPMILCMGADFFRTLGTAQTTGTKLFTLCGNVKNPGVYEFQAGITMRELFEDVGGGCPNGKKLKAIQCGGASGPIVGPDKLDTKMSIEDCNAAGANFGAGDLMFIDEDQDIVDVCENLMEFFTEESCGKCTPCREGNFRLLELVRKFKDGTGTETDLDTIEDLASTMMDASLCGLGQASPTPLVSAIKYFRNEFLERGNQ